MAPHLAKLKKYGYQTRKQNLKRAIGNGDLKEIYSILHQLVFYSSYIIGALALQPNSSLPYSLPKLIKLVQIDAWVIDYYFFKFVGFDTSGYN